MPGAMSAGNSRSILVMHTYLPPGDLGASDPSPPSAAALGASSTRLSDELLRRATYRNLVRHAVTSTKR